MPLYTLIIQSMGSTMFSMDCDCETSPDGCWRCQMASGPDWVLHCSGGGLLVWCISKCSQCIIVYQETGQLSRKQGQGCSYSLILGSWLPPCHLFVVNRLHDRRPTITPILTAERGWTLHANTRTATVFGAGSNLSVPINCVKVSFFLGHGLKVYKCNHTLIFCSDQFLLF